MLHDGASEVAAQDVGCPAEILNEHRTIEPEFLPQARQIVRGRSGPKQDLSWVSGRQMQNKEDDERHADDYDYSCGQSLDEIAPHHALKIYGNTVGQAGNPPVVQVMRP